VSAALLLAVVLTAPGAGAAAVDSTFHTHTFAPGVWAIYTIDMRDNGANDLAFPTIRANETHWWFVGVMARTRLSLSPLDLRVLRATATNGAASNSARWVFFDPNPGHANMYHYNLETTAVTYRHEHIRTTTGHLWIR
jgi:hypothetical protein